MRGVASTSKSGFSSECPHILHSVGVILSWEIPRRGALHGHLGTGQGLRTILLNLLAWSLQCSECL